MNFERVYICDPNHIDRVIKLNHVRDYIIIALFESFFKHEKNRIKVMRVLDAISLNVIDRDVENSEHDIGDMRVRVSGSTI